MATVVVGQAVVDASSISAASPQTPTSPQSLPQPPSLARYNMMVQNLLQRGWPPGLTNEMASSIECFPVRYVIVDNSGSMQSMDGQRLVQSGGSFRAISCTRWAELGDVIMDIGKVVTELHAETHFHLLNPSRSGQYFILAASDDDASNGLFGRAGAAVSTDALQQAMNTSPTGTTPLTEAVQLVTQLIAPAAESLAASGQKAVVVLATDGLPNDQRSFLRALQDLQRLPVWLVVRLCTDEPEIVDYWGDLDKKLEAPLEVLDDITGEAKEVAGHNPWLTYAPALQLSRTVGMSDKLFDLLDEAPLLPSQVKQLIERLIGCGELVEPEIDATAFISQVRDALTTLPPVYNPITQRMAPWIELQKLQKHIRMHGPGARAKHSWSCSVM